MIDRKGLVLVEVGQEKYKNLKERLLEDPLLEWMDIYLSKRESIGCGFAEIKTPLICNSCEELVESARESNILRRFSVRIWDKDLERHTTIGVKKKELYGEVLEQLIKGANEEGILWMGLPCDYSIHKKEINSEILFQLDRMSGKVQSRLINMPSIDKEFYTWESSNGQENYQPKKDYTSIIGILPALIRG